MRPRLIFSSLALMVGLSFGLWVGVRVGILNYRLQGPAKETTTLGVQDYLAETGSCQPPQSGCPEGKYWDYYECQCRSESSGSTCYEPSGGCGTNYYWDNNICDCVYSGSSSCTEPTSGCPEGKYWDYYECQCRSESSGSTCYEPSGGCGTNYYWDNNICDCVYSGSTISPSPYSGSTYDDDEYYGGIAEPTYTVDRLAQVDEATLSCLKKRLNEDELRKLRFFVPITPEEEERLRDVEDKARVCFESYSEVKRIEEASRELTEMSEEVVSCLINAVGEKVYEEVSSGLREPTAYEQSLGNSCFTGEYKSTIRYQTEDQELVTDVEDCLALAIGGEKFDEVKSGLAQVSYEEREKIERCFGASPQPFQGRPDFELPQEVDSCLRENMGLGRYLSIKIGQTEPTDEEREKGEQCFVKLDDTQASFLPPPPDQVPYLTASPNTIGVVTVSERIEEVTPEVTGRKFVLSGTGPPGSLVDIFIFSEPIVVTTTTDENGEWIYEMNQPLEEGRHVAYATVRTQSGQVVRSSVFDFTVAAAEPPLGVPLLEEQKATRVPNRFLTYAFLLIGVGVIIVMGGGAYVYIRRVNREKPVNKEGESRRI